MRRSIQNQFIMGAAIMALAVSLTACGSGTATDTTRQAASATEDGEKTSQQAEAQAETDGSEAEKASLDEPYVLVRESVNTVVYEYAYDENGDKISATINYPDAPDETMYREYTTEYQADGSKIVSESQTFLKTTGEVFADETFEYEYNAEGLLIRETGFNGGEKEGDIFYEYDEKGNLISQSEGKIGPGGTNMARQYEYDDAGNLIKETWFDLDGNPNRSYTYGYDEDGKEIERRTFDGSGEEIAEEWMQSQWRYEYNEEGRIIEEWKESPDGEHTREHYQYEYDEYGNVCKKTDTNWNTTYEYLPLSVHLAGN